MKLPQLTLILVSLNGFAFAATQGPNFPSSGTDDSSFGTTVWTNPGNITADDGSTASLSLPTGTNSHYLNAQGFGFLIPTNSTILGIKVEWKENALCAVSCTRDSRVRIIKGGTVGSTEKSTGAPWPSGSQYVSYGGASDLWGETWTAADINSANFGAVISPQGFGATSTATDVDAVRITVTYTPPPAKGGMLLDWTE